MSSLKIFAPARFRNGASVTSISSRIKKISSTSRSAALDNTDQKAIKPGYDPIAQASSGWLSLNGEADGLPLKAPTFLADDLAGLHAAFSALAALRHRDRTGEGQYIDVALQDALIFQSNGFPTLAAMGAELPRLGGQFMVAAPAGVFRCSDGSIMTGVLTDRHWQVLANLIGHPELSLDPAWTTSAKRVANRDEANALLQRYLITKTKSETVAEFLKARLPVSAVRTYAEAAADPHVKERGMLEEIELEDGSIAPIVGPAAKLSRTPARIQAAAPTLGLDNVAILKELGLDEDAMAALRAEGVIGGLRLDATNGSARVFAPIELLAKTRERR